MSELLDKLPFSRSFLIVLLVIALIVYKIYQPIAEGEEALVSWQGELGEREKNVKQSIESLSISDEHLFACIRRAALERARIHPLNSGGIDDVRELELLYCPGHNIGDLTGIGVLSHLKFVDLSDNHIESLTPLRNNANLKTLNVAGNPLKNIQALAKLPVLKEVYLPSIPESTCADIDSLVKGKKSNFSAKKCAADRKSGIAKRTTGKKKRDRTSNVLTDAQQQELLEYEREMRYQNN